MVKGTHKQMVVLKTSNSRYYEQAYFVLRDGHSPHGEAESNMMAEANRILDESMLMPQPRKRRRPPQWLVFAAGIGIGFLIGLTVMAVM